MKVFYNGEAEGPVEAFGTVFERGKASEVDDRFKEKVKNNKFFGDKATAKASERAPSNPEPSVFEARLNTDGKYSIFRGEQELQDGLSKKDAEAFNGMPADEQAEYVNGL